MKNGSPMRSRLLLATWPKPPECSSLLGIELQVIAHWAPPLNLKSSGSPWKQRVSAARRVMVMDARRWAYDRGYDI